MTMASPRRANKGSNADDNNATDEWIQTALSEYEQIASLCNAQSLLGNAVAATSSSSAPAVDAHDGRRHGDERDLDPKSLTMELQRKFLYDKLSGNYQAVDAVRKTHASLKAQLSSISEMQDDNDVKDLNDGNARLTSRRRLPLSVVAEVFSRHIELSERVIRTVMMQSSPHSKNGPCGVLFENGIVRTSSSAGAHEVNVVALASLRASVSRLKANFGGGGGC
mmetsp:Transcript_33831/g.59381  ORF Transcript_33831/g.59381 Transcript_33831/m.59381 type:complete len:223 (-) Transcript_33831:778-1446(-)